MSIENKKEAKKQFKIARLCTRAGLLTTKKESKQKTTRQRGIMQKIKTNFPMLPELEPIFERLDYKLYFVGGSVRNFMAGLPLTDLDMATPLTPDEVQ